MVASDGYAPAPDLIRGLPPYKQAPHRVRGRGIVGEYSPLCLYPRRPQEWADLYRAHGKPARKGRTAPVRGRARPYKEIRHLHAGLFRGARHVGGSTFARGKAQALETWVERRPHCIRQSRMERSGGGHPPLTFSPAPDLIRGLSRYQQAPDHVRGRGE